MRYTHGMPAVCLSCASESLPLPRPFLEEPQQSVALATINQGH